MTLEELVGQKLVWGIEGARATPEAIAHFRKTHAGGLILFRRNVESTEGVRRLISDLENALGRRLLVMADHEGGRVVHLGEGATVFPDAAALGVTGKVEWAKKQGEIEGEELRSLGLDLNLAPVLDVLTERHNPAIGTRSYGRDPELVAAMGAARIQGMQAKGLRACAKHFPGLGAAEFDPHNDLPTIQKDWKAMKQWDLVPFRKAIEAGVDSVMSSHPVYPELDPKRLPATFSKRIIHDFLRFELGFEGTVLTDDLKMGAISKTVSLKEAAPLAAAAGHDLLLVCSDPKAQLEVFNSLLWAYKKKELKDSELEAGAERIARLKKQVQGTVPQKGDCPLKDLKEGQELARAIARGGAVILADGRGLLPLSPAWCSQHSVFTIFPELTPVADRFYVEPELLKPEPLLKKAFSQFAVSLKDIERISLDPSSGERARLKEIAARYDLVLFFCSDAHLFQGTREFLKVLQGRAKRLVAILLREPDDRKWILGTTACVTAYGFRRPQVEAAIEKLFSGT